MERFLKEVGHVGNENNWQDTFVDNEYIKGIVSKEQAAQRYLGILSRILPTPLENSDRCFKRAMRAL
jgi:mannitol/fructose-specific phosphotransferase system IIA component